MGLFGKKDEKKEEASNYFREARMLTDSNRVPMEPDKAIRCLKKAIELNPYEEKYKRLFNAISAMGRPMQNQLCSISLSTFEAEQKVEFLKGRVQLTKTGIDYKPYSEVIEIPHKAIKGFCFSSTGPHFDHLKGPQFEYLVTYVDEHNQDVEIKLVSTDEAVSSHDWDAICAYTHSVYGEIINEYKSTEHRVLEYPCLNMRGLSDLLTKLCIESCFISPDHNDFKLYSSSECREWLMDIGGYILTTSSIEQIRLRENGRAVYSSEDWGGGHGWHTKQSFGFDYTVKVSSIPEVDLLGLLGNAANYIWDGKGSYVVKEDIELNKMLKKVKAPSIEVKDNHIRYIDERMPSEILFRCIERIAEHVCDEAT